MKKQIKCDRIGVAFLENMSKYYEARIARSKQDLKQSGKEFPNFTTRCKVDLQKFTLFRKKFKKICIKGEEEPFAIQAKELAEEARFFAFNHGFDYRNRPIYIFKDNLYTISGPLTENEKKLIICETADRDRVFFERLKSRYSGEQIKEAYRNRERISEKVRVAVWRRDSGKCSKCGSRERLEYDHIIPLSAGGSSTVRNIELLCEKCNRSKGKMI